MKVTYHTNTAIFYSITAKMIQQLWSSGIVTNYKHQWSNYQHNFLVQLIEHKYSLSLQQCEFFCNRATEIKGWNTVGAANKVYVLESCIFVTFKASKLEIPRLKLVPLLWAVTACVITEQNKGHHDHPLSSCLCFQMMWSQVICRFL